MEYPVMMGKEGLTRLTDCPAEIVQLKAEGWQPLPFHDHSKDPDPDTPALPAAPAAVPARGKKGKEGE